MSKTEKAAEIQSFEDSVGEIVHLKTQFDVIRFMKKIAETYGCRNFMVLNLPPITSRELSENTIITNWPAELMSLFDRHGLMQTSVALRHLRNSTLPYSFDLDSPQAERADPSVRETFVRFGLHRGSFFPVHEPSGIRGAVAFGGSGKPLDHQQMMELMYLSVHVFQRLAEIRTLDVKTTDVLTERETDCLNWTAAGKTSAEIADILGLSEHTVNHYLNRAARKLDTVNRTQAVAKALRIGLIK
ncbi:helix-turn-helix transcriptional regulator [Neorhizobium alkalisoli]|uniref:DNA-binding CsgD family transcriptional regulator n=1 Tax=Neorhizobium alkalisoli TaxID=528178 RepID=A0A561R3X1_9HYPH|nr:LuxR family transcriptional regulator [Neorhizobium alkalisoli]TWF57300.1 DNA-binding CsgD family transcriptional regulator [Neorhizobium alkalisoli]